MSGAARNISLGSLRAYERGAYRSRSIPFEAILFALMIVLLLLALVIGAGVYRTISQTRWADEQSRTGLALIANSVHITDSIDAVGVGVGPEGQSLVLTETVGDSAFETRIYLFEGAVVEEYSPAGAPYAPSKATELVASSVFEFSYADQLLSVHTSQGTEHIMLHSVRRSNVYDDTPENGTRLMSWEGGEDHD